MSLAIGGLWLLLLGAPRLAQPSPFWSPTAPLPRPYAQLLVASPADDRNLYAVAGDASQVSALFESVDGGASWTELAPLPADERIASLAIDPWEPWLLLRSTDRSDTGATVVNRSPDGGRTWQPSLDPGVFCGPVGFAREGAVALVGCGSQLFRTFDGGESWSSVANPFGSRRFTSAPDGSVLAFGDGIYRTVDDGTSWTRIGSLPDCSDVAWLAVSPSNPLELLVGAFVPHVLGILCGGVFRSVDGGATWEQTLAGRAVDQIEFDVHSPSRAVASIGPSGFNSPSPFSGVFETDDGGRTWREFPPPGGVSDLPIGIALSASGRALYASVFSASVFAHRYRRPALLAPR
jgi:photosystem II stability/assembly factor-like uncharacterized protein